MKLQLIPSSDNHSLSLHPINFETCYTDQKDYGYLKLKPNFYLTF
jgi:hypothetical protein